MLIFIGFISVALLLRRVLLRQLQRFRRCYCLESVDGWTPDHILPDCRRHHLLGERNGGVLFQTNVRAECGSADDEAGIAARLFPQPDYDVSRGDSRKPDSPERPYRLLTDARVGITRRCHQGVGYCVHRWDRDAGGVTGPRTNRVDGARSHAPESVVACGTNERVESELVGWPLRKHVDCLYSPENIVV